MKQILLITTLSLLTISLCAGPDITPLIPKTSVAAHQFPNAKLTLQYTTAANEFVMRPLHHADAPILLNSDGTAEFVRNFHTSAFSNFFNIGPRELVWCLIGLSFGVGIATFVYWFAKPNPINIDLSKNKGVVNENVHKQVQKPCSLIPKGQYGYAKEHKQNFVQNNQQSSSNLISPEQEQEVYQKLTGTNANSGNNNSQ